MTARLIFELPLPENLGNSRMHWRAKHGAKLDYWRRLDDAVLLKNIPRPPRTPWPGGHANVVVRTLRKMDVDNAAARVKWPLDWLQSRGYIVNDRDLTLSVKAEAAPRDACGITLTLEPPARVA